MSNKKELVEKNEQLPADIFQLLMEDIGSGQENMTKEDFAIPRLAILQPTSPKVDKRNGEYVEGAEASMIIESVSNQLFDGEEGIVIVPVTFRRTIIEWGLREKGGGFLDDHGNNPQLLLDCKKDDKGRLINERGNQLVDTCEYYVFIVTEEGHQPAVLSMSSTQISKSKRWNTLINNIRVQTPQGKISPAIFYMSYRFTTVPESNEKGNWIGWAIKKEKPTMELEDGKNIYLDAREFQKQIKEGSVKVAEPLNESSHIEPEDSPM